MTHIESCLLPLRYPGEERLEDTLSDFRQALGCVKSLCCPMDDAYLLRFLRARKFNVDEAVKLVKKYYEMKIKYDMLAHIRVSAYKWIYDKGFLLVLRHRDVLGRKILYIRTRLWDPRDMSMDQMSMATFFLLHEMTNDPDTQRNGVLLIVDHAGVTFGQARGIVSLFSLREIQRMVLFFQGSYPARFKGIHSVNNLMLFHSAYKVAQYLIRPKIRKRIILHGNGFEGLHAAVSPDILPQCLDGDLTLDQAEDKELLQKLFANEEMYHDHWKFGYRDS